MNEIAIWEAAYDLPDDDENILDELVTEGDLVSDIIPLQSGHINLTGYELSELLERAAYKGFMLAEARRQYFQCTPDGRIDKTLSKYKPLPYHTARSQSSSLLVVQGSGSEEWKGDPPIERSPELLDDIASRLFSVFPLPLQLQEGDTNGTSLSDAQ